MTDLRAILGAKYDDTIEKVAGAIAGETDYLGCGCCTGYDYDEAVKRTGHEERANMAAHDALAAVLPDLLAAANARAEDAEAKARRFANLLGNNAKALNDTLPAEVLRQKAAAFDEGRRLGLRQADYEMGAALNMPNLANPYQQDTESTEAGA